MRQRSVSGDNLVFYFFNISWLRLQQNTKSVNIKLERRDLTAAQKIYPFPDGFGEIFALNLIKENVTYFYFIFLTQN